MKFHSEDQKIVMGTSIAPTNIENQVLAVRSWVKSGFRVISCNIREEIEIIKPYFAEVDIEFEEVICDIDEVRSKPLPYIYDIMMVIYYKTKKVAGYINSDIFLENISEDLYEFLYKEADDSLLIVKRNEINSLADISDLNWQLFSGIDMFLIDKKFIPGFFNEGFFVQSNWDIGILLKAKLCGIGIKELMNPIAFHIRHTQICNFTLIRTLTERLWNKYFGLTENAFEHAMESFYNISFEDCKQVCFLEDRKLTCLFVIKTENAEVKKSIRAQESVFIDIVMEKSNIDKERYDYVFYIPDNTILTPVFCKTVIFIMTRYRYGELEVGRFFVSRINEKYQYNNLSKSISLLEYIHEQCTEGILASAKKNNGNLKKIVMPIAYEILDIYNKKIFKELKIEGKYYIAPAGIRAEHWHYVNEAKFKKLKFLGYLDNNKKGENIYPMNILLNAPEVYVVIACNLYVREIMYQMQQLKQPDKVINAGFICYIDQEGIIYYFDLEQYKNTYRSLDYEKEEKGEK